MNSNDIINQLAKELTPVKPVMGVYKKSALWLLIGAAYACFMVLVLGLRDDISVKITQHSFLLEMVIALLASLSSGFVAVTLSVPDQYQLPKTIQYLPFSFMSMLLGILLYSWMDVSTSFVPSALECSLEITMFSVFPMIVMIYAIRKAATTHSIMCSAMTSLSAVHFSYILLRVIEQNDNTPHILYWHYSPMIIVVIFGMMVGSKLLKW